MASKSARFAIDIGPVPDQSGRRVTEQRSRSGNSPTAGADQVNQNSVDHQSRSRAKSRKPRAPNAPPGTRSRFRVHHAVNNKEIVYQDLRRDIVAMTLVPGGRISEKEIARQYGISRTPVREAVMRLAEERLVEVVAKSGTFVARIPLSLLPEALVARKALESATVSAAARVASESQIMGLKALIQRQRETAETGQEEAFHKADEDFHAGIAVAANYGGIWNLIQQVKIHVDRYRRLTLPQPGRMKLVVHEHSEIVDAITAGDADLAVRKMEDHLNKLRLDIAIFRDMWPDYFIHDIALDEEPLA
jgi:DNA-binding GntR family transcriptional regulator